MPIGGSHSHTPNHETARNRPITVAMDASAGHSRSQKIVQRARLSARASTLLSARSGGEAWRGVAASGECSVNYVSSRQNLPNFRY